MIEIGKCNIKKVYENLGHGYSGFEYQQGKNILDGQHHKECSRRLGNWTESSLSFKIGYSRDYVVD